MSVYCRAGRVASAPGRSARGPVWEGDAAFLFGERLRSVDISMPLYEFVRQNRDCGGRHAPWSRAGGEEGKSWEGSFYR